MDYQLAKKLKKAGFPFNWDHWFIQDKEPLGVFLSYPKLSDLIRECVDFGRPIEIVINPDGKADAKEVNRPDHYSGNTLEEAVVNLWLNLNKLNHYKNEQDIRSFNSPKKRN